ncbi:unnamed protein product, partial [Iphiclides podalirius]
MGGGHRCASDTALSTAPIGGFQATERVTSPYKPPMDAPHLQLIAFAVRRYKSRRSLAVGNANAHGMPNLAVAMQLSAAAPLRGL